MNDGIGELARSIAILESINEKDQEKEDRENNRATINRMLTAMESLINIESNRAQAEINLMEAQAKNTK